MAYAKVIVNALSGGGYAGKKWPHISHLLTSAGLSFDSSFTEGPGHAIQLGEDAVKAGYELVIAVGGDGTVNEVVNGIVDGNGRGMTTLGIISTGTGRDAVRALGIPRDYTEACRVFPHFGRMTIDLGHVEYISNNQKRQQFYINGAGLGFDAEALDKKTRFKVVSGTIPYVWALLTTITTYRNKEVTLKLDDECWKLRAFMIAVNNGRCFGGGMKIAPDADPCDGLLDVVTVADVGRVYVLRNFLRIYRGTHISLPTVKIHRAKCIEVRSADKLLLQLDGDLVGEAPATFRVLPGTLTVAVCKEGGQDG